MYALCLEPATAAWLKLMHLARSSERTASNENSLCHRDRMRTNALPHAFWFPLVGHLLKISFLGISG